MLRNRFLILLGGCLLASSAVWADEVGYVDCSNHPDEIQVFAKARKTPDLVASLPCGERFTVLVYGFVFSRIQTKDGNVGYIYSNLIAVDRAATAAQQAGSTQLASAKIKIPSANAPVARPAPVASIQAQPAPPRSAAAKAPEPASSVPEMAVAAAQPATAQQTPMKARESTPSAQEPAASVVLTNPPPSMQPESAPAPPATSRPEPVAAVAQPDRNALAQPESAPAEPATRAIRPADTRTSWERPRPGGIRRAPLLELFGGYAFARLDGGGGTGTNVNGAMGSFGWNVKPWLQFVADSSYNAITISGTKNILYGNHFGARYFHRGRNRWGLTPFAEALVGGSRADTKVSGSSTYNTSQNCLSYKVGGGLDIHPFRHIDIRLFDADYYRTSFGTNAHQNNYWISTGIVIRLFGGGSE
jgi:hypothetical protein